jgi:hypothetical protein
MKCITNTLAIIDWSHARYIGKLLPVLRLVSQSANLFRVEVSVRTCSRLSLGVSADNWKNATPECQQLHPKVEHKDSRGLVRDCFTKPTIMAPIRVALVGLSASTKVTWTADAHLPYLLSSRGKQHYELVALLNSSVEAAESAKATFGLTSTLSLSVPELTSTSRMAAHREPRKRTGAYRRQAVPEQHCRPSGTRSTSHVAIERDPRNRTHWQDIQQ